MIKELPSYITKNDILRIQNLYFRGHEKETIAKITNIKEYVIETIIYTKIDKKFHHTKKHISDFVIRCILRFSKAGISSIKIDEYFHLTKQTSKNIISKYGNMKEHTKAYLERKHQKALARQKLKRKQHKQEIIAKREWKKKKRLENIFLEDERNKTAIIPIYQEKTLDIEYFKIIDSAEKAYWLGFLSGDAYATPKSMTIGLSIVDVDHLQKLRLALNCNNNLDYVVYHDLFKTEARFYRLQINDAKFAKYFLQYKDDKPILRIPRIKSEYIRHFIRGILDADGCISVSDCISKSDKKIQLNFSGYKPLLEDIQQEISNSCNVYTKICKQGSIFQLHYAKSASLKILEWLYKNATIYLTRKYNEYLKAL